MHKVTGQSGGIVWPIGAYSDPEAALEAHEAAWFHYQQACHVVRCHPPITLRLIDPSGKVVHTRTASPPSRAERGPGMIPVVAGGIPALAKVMCYYPGRPAYRPVGNMRAAEPEEPAEVEVELYDRKGYRAKWLEDNMTEDQYLLLNLQVLSYLEGRE